MKIIDFMKLFVFTVVALFMFFYAYSKNEAMQEERNKMYVCDAYAYTKDAPLYCK